jgi:tagatose-6-phosphate ketose/aldose isomerase
MDIQRITPASALSSFLDLSLEEKERRGLLFTPAEIDQQPRSWRTTLQVFERHQQEVCSFLTSIGINDTLQNRPTVLLVGAGTSDYVAQALESLFREKWGCEVSAVASTSLLPNIDEYLILGRNYLWISFSRSGDSPEGVAVLEQALQSHPNVSHLVVTCNVNARMAQLCRGVQRACVIVLDDAVNDRSLAMTSSFTNLIVMGQCLAYARTLDDYKPLFEQLVLAGEDLLQIAPQKAEAIAAHNVPRICFVGTGPLASVARESALKVLEMTAGQVKTLSETILGLRHGPMAALDNQALFVCFVPGDPRRAQYAKDLLCEVGQKQIAVQRIAVGPAHLQADLAPACDLFLPLTIDTQIHDTLRPVLDVIFGQLLGLYLSVAHNLKPDSPSPSGVINRVVQAFQIY